MIKKLARLVGYMRAEVALGHGFTDHGSMYGVPCWVCTDGPDLPLVTAKWDVLNYAIDIGDWLTGFQPDPTFQIIVKQPIEAAD